MAQIGYLIRRLPPLLPASKTVGIGPETFSDLILDGELRYWASGVLEWLRLANWRSVRRNLPPPYPDARSAPRMSWPDDPWAAYYERYGSLVAPPLIRGWMLEDAAMLNARAAATGGALALPSNLPADRRLDGLLQADSGSMEAAVSRDRGTVQFHFQWLDEHLFTADPDSSDRVYAYALKLLVLLRNGSRLEHHEAA